MENDFNNSRGAMLLTAVEHGDKAGVLAMLALGVDVSTLPVIPVIANNRGCPAEMIDLVLLHGAKVNAIKHPPMGTGLMMAVKDYRYGDSAAKVERLLAHKASVAGIWEVIEEQYWTPPPPELFRLLHSYGHDINPKCTSYRYQEDDTYLDVAIRLERESLPHEYSRVCNIREKEAQWAALVDVLVELGAHPTHPDSLAALKLEREKYHAERAKKAA